MKEIWKDIPDYSRYKVSNFGRIKSYCINDEGTMRKLTTAHNGYKSILLVRDKNKGKYKIKVFYIHRLVAEAFIGNIDEKHVHHIDADKTNNHVDNLEIVNTKEHGQRTKDKNDFDTIKQESNFGNKYYERFGIIRFLYLSGMADENISLCADIAGGPMRKIIKGRTGLLLHGSTRYKRKCDDIVQTKYSNRNLINIFNCVFIILTNHIANIQKSLDKGYYTSLITMKKSYQRPPMKEVRQTYEDNFILTKMMKQESETHKKIENELAQLIYELEDKIVELKRNQIHKGDNMKRESTAELMDDDMFISKYLSILSEDDTDTEDNMKRESTAELLDEYTRKVDFVNMHYINLMKRPKDEYSIEDTKKVYDDNCLLTELLNEERNANTALSELLENKCIKSKKIEDKFARLLLKMKMEEWNQK